MPFLRTINWEYSWTGLPPIDQMAVWTDRHPGTSSAAFLPCFALAHLCQHHSVRQGVEGGQFSLGETEMELSPLLVKRTLHVLNKMMVEGDLCRERLPAETKSQSAAFRGQH